MQQAGQIWNWNRTIRMPGEMKASDRISLIFVSLQGILQIVKRPYPSRRCLHFEVVGGLAWSNDRKSYAGGSVATGRASHAGKVEGDDPD
jgi:hypothetical protein